MTCIVGLVEDGYIFMGGDRCGGDVDTYRVTTIASPKVFAKGSRVSDQPEMIIGYTSSFRLGQLLQYDLVLPKIDCEGLGMVYMVKKFIPAVHDLLQNAGWVFKKDDRHYGGNFLVGAFGALYEIDSDFAIIELPGLGAVGCGGAYALGAMDALANSCPNQSTRISYALSAAARFNAFVMPPFDAVRLPEFPRGVPPASSIKS